jgi:stage IV sporulation protein FB
VEQLSGEGVYQLFRWRGTSVSVSTSFLIVAALIALDDGGLSLSNLLWLFTVAFSILWHEFGHAFAFERYGCGPSAIVLQGFGGVTINRPPSGRWPRILTSFAGPFASLALLALPLMLLSYAIYGELLGPRSVRFPHEQLLRMLIACNLIWGVFNLLPIYPMDGGQMLLHFIRPYSSRPARMTALVGLLFLGPLLYFSFQLGMPFMILILGLMTWQNYQLYQHGGRGF